MPLSQKKIYGLIGCPVKHSLSAKMHNAAFAALGILAEYRLFEVNPADLEGFLSGNLPVKDTEGILFPSAEVIGFNITIPHKVAAFLFVEALNREAELDYSARMTGAVNTVKRVGQKLVGANTDVKGFMDSLQEGLRFNPENKNIIVFGCGGAGRAVVAGFLPQEGCKVKKISVYDANRDAVTAAKKQFSSPVFKENKDRIEFLGSPAEISKKFEGFDLLVNATPIGMKAGDASIIDKSLFKSNSKIYVYDVVYNRQTQLILDAKAAGCLAVDGLSMLLYQGVAAFELWTGKQAPVELMRCALEEGAKKL